MAASPRRLARTLLTLVAVVALVVPVALALTTGWIEVHSTPWGEQPVPDPTPLESWVALALVYLVWAPLVLVGLVAAFDRLGHQYMPIDRDRRPTRKERRRQAAGIRLLQSQQAPPTGAQKARPKRGAAPPKDGA
jgi:hypothetical protein